MSTCPRQTQRDDEPRHGGVLTDDRLGDLGPHGPEGGPRGVRTGGGGIDRRLGPGWLGGRGGGLGGGLGGRGGGLGGLDALGGVGGRLGGLGRCGLGRRCRLGRLHGHGLFGHRCASLVLVARACSRSSRASASATSARSSAGGGPRSSAPDVVHVGAGDLGCADGDGVGTGLRRHGQARRDSAQPGGAQRGGRPATGPRTPVQPGAALQRLDRADRDRQRLAHQGAEPPGPPHQGEHHRDAELQRHPAHGGRQGLGERAGAHVGGLQRVGHQPRQARAGTQQPQREGGVGVLVEVGVAQHVGLPEHGEVARQLHQRTRPRAVRGVGVADRGHRLPLGRVDRASRAGGPGRGRRGAGGIDGPGRLDAGGPDADAEGVEHRRVGFDQDDPLRARAQSAQVGRRHQLGVHDDHGRPAAGDHGRVRDARDRDALPLEDPRDRPAAVPGTRGRVEVAVRRARRHERGHAGGEEHRQDHRHREHGAAPDARPCPGGRAHDRCGSHGTGAGAGAVGRVACTAASRLARASCAAGVASWPP